MAGILGAPAGVTPRSRARWAGASCTRTLAWLTMTCAGSQSTAVMLRAGSSSNRGDLVSTLGLRSDVSLGHCLHRVEGVREPSTGGGGSRGGACTCARDPARPVRARLTGQDGPGVRSGAAARDLVHDDAGGDTG